MALDQVQVQAARDTLGSAKQGYSPLRYQRLLRGWSQRELADVLYERCVASGTGGVGIDPTMISRWEQGRRKPALMYQKHLCQLFEMTTEQLGWL